MTAYNTLIAAEQTCHTIEIREKATGKTGVANSVRGDGESGRSDANTVRGDANSNADMVAVFYGSDDGSDDKVITAEAFDRDFEITATIEG